VYSHRTHLQPHVISCHARAAASPCDESGNLFAARVERLPGGGGEGVGSGGAVSDDGQGAVGEGEQGDDEDGGREKKR